MRKKLLVPFLAAITLSLHADIALSAWRGETVSFRTTFVNR